MKTSVNGLHQLMQREGVKLRAYKDSRGINTIGCGHTGRMSPPMVDVSMTITKLQCQQYLASDLAPVERTINSVIKKPMTQNQFDAMVSLAFNIGNGGFTGSSVVHHFNNGDIKGAANSFLMWEKPASLKTRRESERKQFLGE